MIHEQQFAKDPDVRFLREAIEITGWNDDQIAAEFPGMAQLYAIIGENGRLFVHAATASFGRDAFLEVIDANKSVKKDVGINTVIVDGPLAVSQLLSSLPAIIREDCEP